MVCGSIENSNIYCVVLVSQDKVGGNGLGMAFEPEK